MRSVLEKVLWAAEKNVCGIFLDIFSVYLISRVVSLRGIGVIDFEFG